MRPYSPGGALNALASAQQGSTPAAPSAHRLRRGLPGYLILFATHAFAPQRQFRSREPPSPPVFLPVSTHFTATLGIPLPPPGLKQSSFKGRSSVEPRAFTFDLPSRLRALYAVIPNNARPLRITSAAGTELAGASFGGTVSSHRLLAGRHFFPPDRSFTTRRPSSSTRRRWVRLAPIAQNSPLLPPVGVWAVSQSQCGRSPSQAGYRSMPW